MNDTLTNAWFHRLKSAHRKLIKKNGGIDDAAEIALISSSQIGRCNSETDNQFLPIVAVLKLEAECGDPVVTRAMAGLHGMKLIDPEEKVTDAGCLMRSGMNVAATFNEFQRESMLSFADLKVTPAEARAVLKTLETLSIQIADLTNQWASVAGSGGTVPGLKVVGE